MIHGGVEVSARPLRIPRGVPSCARARVYNTRAVRALDRLATTRIGATRPRRRWELFRAVEAAETGGGALHRYRARAAAVPHPIALTRFVIRENALPGTRAARRPRPSVRDPRAGSLAGRRRRLSGRSARERGDCRVDRARCGARAGALAAHDPSRRRARGDGRPARWSPSSYETNATGGSRACTTTPRACGSCARRSARAAFSVGAGPRPRRSAGSSALVARWVQAAARRVVGGASAGRVRGGRAPVDGYSEVPRLVEALPGVRAFPRRRAGSPSFAESAAACGSGPARGRRLPRSRARGYRAADRPASRGLPRSLTRARLVPGVAGEFGHRGLECLLRPELGVLFTPGERRLLRRACPGRACSAPRVSADVAGRRVDLPEFARRARERLTCRNVGRAGAACSSAARRGLRDGRRGSTGPCESPGAGSSRPAGPAPGGGWSTFGRGGLTRAPATSRWVSSTPPGDLGLHVRVSREPVVNVARQGAVACAFLVGRWRVRRQARATS